jgi:hypothetical protein
MKLIQNPIFRIIGIGVILYYGLLYNKSHPDSLANRLAPQKVKNNLTEISEKSTNIITNIKKAEDIKKSLANPNQGENSTSKTQQNGQ